MRASALVHKKMNQETIRAFCKKLPHVTESVQWGHDLVFKVGGKMFCVMATEPVSVPLSFKASHENFIALQEIDGVVPAPYMARAQWVAIKRFGVFQDAEFKELLREAHSLVFSSLTKKLQAELTAPKKKTARKTTQRSAGR